MDLVPLRAAAGGGSIDGLPAAQLVAAGFTLLQRNAALVRALAGRRAAILAPTSPAFLVALAASDGRGAVLVNPLAAAPEIAEQLAEANVGAVFTVEALAKRLPPGTVHVLLDDAPVAATVVSGDGRPQRVDLGSHFGLGVEGDADAPGRDEECAIVYTSAMAGRPLGAILTHRNLLANARQTVQAASLTSADRVLAVLPFAHLFGLTVSGLAPLLAGARVHTMPRFHPIAAVDHLEREATTMLVGVPAIFAAMLGAIERRGGRLASETLRLCICGGAPLTAGLQERWAAATGVELRQGYGLTEASPVALFNPIAESNRRGSLGKPFPGVQVSVRDPASSRPLEPGTAGELCIRGETVFRGYVRGGELGLRVRDGWLHTGDRGVERGDGSFEFLGVLKPMFTRNGFNIYPAELEAAVRELPGVRAVRVSAIPDAAREHEIGLEVEVARASGIGEAEVRAWCERRLSAYKLPGVIRVAAHAG